MFKSLLRKRILLYSALFPGFKIEPEDVERYKEARGLYIENDWERLKSMFQLDEFGNFHPEIEYAIAVAQFGLILGGLIGGSYQSIVTTQEFIRTNDAKVYMTRNEALRILSNQATMGFIKGMWKYAPKYTIFITGFSIFSSCCELYRNKAGIVENTVGGAGVGGMLRSHFGVKGIISGGVVGGILGTIYGLITTVICKIGRTDKLELKYAAVAFSRYKKKYRELKVAEQETKKEKEFFESRFSESKEDKSDRLKLLDMEKSEPLFLEVLTKDSADENNTNKK